MSEVKDPNGGPESVANGASQEIESVANGADNSTVKYDTYRKVVSANRAKDAKLDEMANQLAELQNNQLAAEGKKDELIASLQSRVNELDGKYKGAVGSFASGKALDAIVDVAVQAGCNSTGLLRKVVQERLGEFEYDEQFNPNADQVKMLVEEIRKSEPILFGKDAPKIPPHNLNPTDVNSSKQTKSLNNMDDKELNAAFAAALRNER